MVQEDNVSQRPVQHTNVLAIQDFSLQTAPTGMNVPFQKQFATMAVVLIRRDHLSAHALLVIAVFTALNLKTLVPQILVVPEVCAKIYPPQIIHACVIRDFNRQTALIGTSVRYQVQFVTMVTA